MQEFLSNENVIIHRGSNIPAEIIFIDEVTSSFFDFTGNTEILVCLKNEDGTELNLLKTTGGVSIIGLDTSGRIQIKPSVAQSLLLKLGKSISFYMQITFSSGDIRIIPFENRLDVLDAVCG